MENIYDYMAIGLIALATIAASRRAWLSGSLRAAIGLIIGCSLPTTLFGIGTVVMLIANNTAPELECQAVATLIALVTIAATLLYVNDVADKERQLVLTLERDCFAWKIRSCVTAAVSAAVTASFIALIIGSDIVNRS